MAVFIDFFRNAEAQPPFTESQTITPALTSKHYILQRMKRMNDPCKKKTMRMKTFFRSRGRALSRP